MLNSGKANKSHKHFVVILEVRPDQKFVVYHIEYDKLLLQEHPEYLFFQEMLASDKRIKIAQFLQLMFDHDWVLLTQSQNVISVYYTLHKQFVI